MIPQLRAWHERYRQAGLVVVGVHAPEFFWERSRDRVAAAARRLGVEYPVVQDNDLAIWNRYGVRAWPTLFLIDRAGLVRHSHVGEGAYAATEALIRRLLADPG